MDTFARLFQHFVVIKRSADDPQGEGGGRVVQHCPASLTPSDRDYHSILPKFCTGEECLANATFTRGSFQAALHAPATTSFSLGTYFDRLFCVCVRSYQLRAVDEETDTVVAEPVFLCLTSHLPLFPLLRTTLQALHHAVCFTTTHSSTECILHTIMGTRLCTMSEALDITFSVDTTHVVATHPGLCSLKPWPPLHHAAPTLLSLPSDVLLDVVVALMLESRVVVCGLDKHERTQAMLGMVELLHPLKWVGPLLPIIPASMLVYVTSPLPYFIGVAHDQKQQTIETVERQSQSVPEHMRLDGLLLDLENKSVHRFDTPLPLLPEHIRQRAHHGLAELRARQASLNESELAQELSFLFRQLVSHVLRKYPKYIRTRNVLDGRESDQPFDTAAFAQEHHSCDAAFVERLCATQLFEQLITERLSRSAVRSKDVLVQHDRLSFSLMSLSPPSCCTPPVVPASALAQDGLFFGAARVLVDDQSAPFPFAKLKEARTGAGAGQADERPQLAGFPEVDMDALKEEEKAKPLPDPSVKRKPLPPPFINYLRTIVTHFPLLSIINLSLHQRVLTVRRGDWNDRLHRLVVEGFIADALNDGNQTNGNDRDKQQGGGEKPDTFGSIQQAINDAAPGAKIRVKPGVYDERLVLDKSVMLVGEGIDRGDVIVRAAPGAPVLTITACAATVRNMTFVCAKPKPKKMAASFGFGLGLGSAKPQASGANNAPSQGQGGSGSDACVLFAPGSGRSQLSGCAVRSDTDVCVLVCSDTSPTLYNNVIEKSPGCGIRVEDRAQPLIRKNIVRHHSGCGVFVVGDDAAPTIVDNHVMNNAAHGIAVVPLPHVAERVADEQPVDAAEFGGAEWLEERLTAYYKRHNPDKLQRVKEVAGFYCQGWQVALHNKLREQYNEGLLAVLDQRPNVAPQGNDDSGESEGSHEEPWAKSVPKGVVEEFEAGEMDDDERRRVATLCAQFWVHAQVAVQSAVAAAGAAGSGQVAAASASGGGGSIAGLTSAQWREVMGIDLTMKLYKSTREAVKKASKALAAPQSNAEEARALGFGVEVRREVNKAASQEEIEMWADDGSAPHLEGEKASGGEQGDQARPQDEENAQGEQQEEVGQSPEPDADAKGAGREDEQAAPDAKGAGEGGQVQQEIPLELRTLQLSSTRSVRLARPRVMAKSAVIVGNYVSENQKDGIRVACGGHHTVLRNVVRHSHHSGIVARGGKDLVVDVVANSVSHSSRQGIAVGLQTRGVVRGNILDSNVGPGLAVREGAAAVVEWNIVTGGVAGVQLSSGAKAFVRGNVFHKGTRNGIELLRGVQARVEQNVVLAPEACGVYLGVGHGEISHEGNIISQQKALVVWDTQQVIRAAEEAPQSN